MKLEHVGYNSGQYLAEGEGFYCWFDSIKPATHSAGTWLCDEVGYGKMILTGKVNDEFLVLWGAL